MKVFRIALITAVAMLFGISFAYAGATLTSTSVNNNYLGIGGPEGVKHSQGEVNTQLQPMATPLTMVPEYGGPVFKDHKFQKEILDFLLREDALKPFRVRSQKSPAKSDSQLVLADALPSKERVFVFRGEAELMKFVEKFKTVGYIDTYSEGSATLVDCFNQAILDSGKMGGNILVLLKVDFMAGIKSTTVGVGASGATGLMHGGSGASVGGMALGYASSTAKPRTNPYIHGIVLYAEELQAVEIKKQESLK